MGDALTPEIIIDFAAAFGTVLEGETVLVGRDTRQSSRMIHAAVTAGLVSTGCSVLDFGVCPTPMLQFSTSRYDASGAVSITGGHNAMGSNAIQLISASGAFIEPIGGQTVLDVYHSGDFTRAKWNSMGSVKEANDFTAPYFEALLELLDIDAIRKANLTVAIDPVNGAGCRYIETFGQQPGIKVLPVNNEESGYLARDPEPRPRNARPVASLMNLVPADIGFVSSSDMGRLSIVTENGETASEEFTLPIIVEHILGHASGVVVTNCCTSRMVEDVAAGHDASVVKTRVGQAYVLSALADEDGVIGGEGSGGVALPRFSKAFDAFLMMGLILERMAKGGLRASQLIGNLPRYHIVKRMVAGEAHRCYRAIDQLADNSAWINAGKVSTRDGLRIDWQDGWIHLRASQTAQVIRVISEAESTQTAEARANDAARMLEQVL